MEKNVENHFFNELLTVLTQNRKKTNQDYPYIYIFLVVFFI